MKKKTKKAKKVTETPAHFWVIPMGHHSTRNKLEPWALLESARQTWLWYAREQRDTLRAHIREQIGVATDMWREALKLGEQGALLSSCSYPQGRFLDIAQIVQRLATLQGNITMLEVHHRVEIEWDGTTPVFDFTHRPCEDVLHWAPHHLKHMARVFEIYGLVHESKTESVELPGRSETPYRKKEFIEFMEKLVKPLEVDGWKADLREGHNSHRHVGNTYSVVFHRHVPAQTWPTAEAKEE